MNNIPLQLRYLPTISIEMDKLPTIPDKDLIDIIYDKLEEYYNFIKQCIRIHTTKIIGCGVIVLLTGLIIAIVLSQKVTPFPCSQYSSNDLASSVSVACLSYLWKVCCTGTFDTSNSWWSSSPQGSTSILCSSFSSSTSCGAGNYGAILMGMQFCNSQYKGHY